MGTTSLGIAFPDDSSPIANLQDHLETLATTTNTAILGGAWQIPALTGGWTNFGGTAQGMRYCKAAGVVFIEGAVKSGSLNSAAFTLPAGFRPSGGYLAFPTITGAGVGHFEIDPAGAVTPRTGNTGFFSITCCFRAG